MHAYAYRYKYQNKQKSEKKTDEFESFIHVYPREVFFVGPFTVNRNEESRVYKKIGEISL
jgi:hypothetical protein